LCECFYLQVMMMTEAIKREVILSFLCLNLNMVCMENN